MKALWLGQPGELRRGLALQVGSEEPTHRPGEALLRHEASKLLRLTARVAKDPLIVAITTAVLEAQVTGLELRLQLVVTASISGLTILPTQTPVLVAVPCPFIAQFPTHEQLAVAAYIEGTVGLAELGVVGVAEGEDAETEGAET